MSIENPNVVDGMGIDRENHALRLLLTDHLAWNGEEALSEYDHLMMLQDKINAYFSWLESRQYKTCYADEEFRAAVIEIHFMHDITENCVKFLQAVREQVLPLEIQIEVRKG